MKATILYFLKAILIISIVFALGSPSIAWAESGFVNATGYVLPLSPDIVDNQVDFHLFYDQPNQIYWAKDELSDDLSTDSNNTKVYIFDAEGRNAFDPWGINLAIDDPAPVITNAPNVPYDLNDNNIWVSAHYYTGKVTQFYNQRLGRNGYDDKGTEMRVVVNSVFLNFVNGIWILNGDNSVYEDEYNCILLGGGATFFRNFAGSIDNIAHEFTHAVSLYIRDPDHQVGTQGVEFLTKEGKSLEESFSDMMACAVEYWLATTVDEFAGTFDWYIGEDNTNSGPYSGTPYLRNLCDPADTHQPDTYPQDPTINVGFWQSINAPNYDTHINAGVPNKMFYLLSDGGIHNGVYVRGIGILNAATLMYESADQWAQQINSLTFSDAKDDCIETAQAYDAANGTNWAPSVQNAWAAVNVGDPVGEVIYLDDMEGGVGGWTATGLWHQVSNSSCTSPGYSSPTTSWYYGQDAICNYDTVIGNIGRLTSPEIPGITSYSKLSFKYWRKVESFSGSFDKTYVEVSSNGGATWTNVWYKDSSDASQARWLQTEEISLAAFAGNSIFIRFTFDTVDWIANDFNGWFIDDVSVTEGTTAATAYINIDHTYRGDLVVKVGVGDPVNPDWVTTVSNREGGSADNLVADVDISTAAAYLPPSISNPWFLEVSDNAWGDVGSIQVFTITYNEETYISNDVPVTISDYQKSYSYIPAEGPEPPVIDAVASYGFSEGSGTLTVDGSVNGNDGTIHGAAWTDGKVGKGLHFDGINDWVEVADAPSLDLVDQITVEAWVNFDDLTDGGIIGKYDNYGYYNYCLWFEGGILYFEIGNRTTDYFEKKVSYSGLNTGTWYHIVGTYDRQNVRLYVNAINVDTEPETREMGTGWKPLCIGNVRYDGVNTHSYNETNEFFRGKIDEVRIYDYALSAGQVNYQYISF